MTIDTTRLRELLGKLPCIPWSKTRGTVTIPATEDYAGKSLPITGLDKQYARNLAAYIAAANPATMAALLSALESKEAEVAKHRAFLSSLRHELGLILTDDDTELSCGAHRALLWADQQCAAALSGPTTNEGA